MRRNLRDVFLFSDMNSLKNLVEQGEVILSEGEEHIKCIQPAQIQSLDKGTTVCNLTREWWAIHFAHSNFELYGHEKRMMQMPGTCHSSNIAAFIGYMWRY